MPVHHREHIELTVADAQAAVLRANIQIRSFCNPYNSDDDEDDDDAPQRVERSRAFATYAAFSVGPASVDKTRRKVRIAMYVAPACEDMGDATNAGLCIDDGNEAELERGVPNTIKFRNVDGRNTGGEGGTRMLFPPVTWFCEWGGAQPLHSIIFCPTFEMPLAEMRVVENHLTEFCVHGYAHALRNCKGCLPEIPPPRLTTAAATVAESIAARTREREAKRKRPPVVDEQEEDEANEAAAPAAAAPEAAA